MLLSSLNSFVKKYKYAAIVFLLLFIVAVCAAFSIGGNDKFDRSRREVLLRKIGDELLLQSGDSTSRVLPVNKIAENEYQISFEDRFSFKPDSLMNITRRLLLQDPLARDYVVYVLNCGNATVAYGFAVAGNKKDDIVACKGRRQPTGCYTLDIKFKPVGLNIARNGYLLCGLPLLAFVGFVVLRSVKPRRTLQTGQFTLGSVVFDAQERQLLAKGEIIPLTGTETRMLLIFAPSPNEIIERSRLQKEIWEDQGVIVGRSLDMFISKLRKKLEADPEINIVVVRNKGYKLQIGS